MNKGELQPNVSQVPALVSFSGRFWFYVFVTGVGAGVAGGLLMNLLYAIQEMTWSYTTGSFLEGVERSSAGWRVLALFGAGVVAGVGGWLLERTTGKEGGEITQAIWFKSGEIPPVRTFCNAIISIVVVGVGASIGREGAIKETGAGVASRLSGGGRLPLPQRRLLVACGAGAGYAVAYNVPFGAALFALEVILGELSLTLLIPALLTTSLATAVSWLFLPNQPTYTIPHYEVTISLLVWAFVAGPLFGLCSVGFIRAIAFAHKIKPHGWRLLLSPVLVLTALGGTAIAFPELLGNGKDLVELSFNGNIGLTLLLVLPALKLLATASCLGSGIPGGLFTPVMTYGALLGGLFGALWSYVFPGSPLGCYALIGSGAVLAAATQGPLSAIVLLMELTYQLDPLAVPVMAAVAGAVLVSRAIDPRTIYSARENAGKVATDMKTSIRTAFDDWIRTDYEVVSAADHYTQLGPRLLGLAASGRPLYVLDQQGQVIGEVDLAQAADHAKLPVPLEMITAADLARPVPVLNSAMSVNEVFKQLHDSGAERLPVADANGGSLLGYVSKRTC